MLVVDNGENKKHLRGFSEVDLLSLGFFKGQKSIFVSLEREPEAVADVDPDDLEDALAGHELDEQDAEEAHLGLVFLRSCIFSGSRTA